MGDGINDAPALAQAGGGRRHGDRYRRGHRGRRRHLDEWRLDGLVTAIALSRSTMRTSCRTWASPSGTTAAGFPVAAGVLYPFTGWLLSPIIAPPPWPPVPCQLSATPRRLRRFRTSFVPSVDVSVVRRAGRRRPPPDHSAHSACTNRQPMSISGRGIGEPEDRARNWGLQGADAAPRTAADMSLGASGTTSQSWRNRLSWTCCAERLTWGALRGETPLSRPRRRSLAIAESAA